MLVARIEQKSDEYADHNRDERGRGFVYARPERVELFRRYVGGPGRSVLDLGCRDGALSAGYLDGNEVVGVDVDREALAHAEELGLKTEWADLDEPLAFEDESFDVVVAGELLEHIRMPQALIDEARRVLRRGGTLVGSTPNGFRLKNRARFAAGRHPEQDPTHLHLFRPDDIRELLSAFEHRRLHFVAGRLVRLQPRLFANVIVFSGQKPR
jgi:2-polyprenyl-3-methyl-5-hydroxy-6-metoxy-1,4-benzoquinol methylase